MNDEALVYCLYLLRAVAFEGRLFDNPYLCSVGLTGEALRGRLQSIDALHVRQLGDVVDVEWAATSLQRWAEQALFRQAPLAGARGARPS